MPGKSRDNNINEVLSMEETSLRERVVQLLDTCDRALAQGDVLKQDEAREALGLAYELQDKKLVADCLFRLGRIQDLLSEPTPAVNSLLEAKSIYESLNQLEDAAACSMYMGESRFRMRDFENALDNYLDALKIHKEYGHLPIMAELYNRIATIYQNTRDWQHASDSFNKALDIYTKIGNDKAITMALFSIGNVYNWSDELEKSSHYLQRSEKKAREIGDDLLILKAVSSIAILYTKQKDYDKSLKYFEDGLALADKLGDLGVRASMLKSLGNLYNKLEQYDQAIKVLDEALVIAEKLDSVVVLTLIHQFYADTYEALGDDKKALHHLKEYYRYDKQIVAEEIKLKTKGLQAKLELEEARKQSEIYRLKNIDLAQAYDEIIRQKSEIQQKNKEITDSISYARRIQEAILPREDLISKDLPDYFIFYRPKDIVSGDFYFYTTVSSPAQGGVVKKWLVIAAVDCTGHGVPGAFMSMIGNNILNQIVVDKKVTSPAIALTVLDQKVVQSLKQYEANTELNDGMDIALCAIDPSDLNLQYSGAHRPLVLIRDGEVTEYKASKYAIGGYHRDDKAFQLENIKLQKGDSVYLFTDGFADQFGGPKGKKFKHKKLIELLQSMYNKPMSEQKQLLDTTFTEWRGDLEQVDDILVIGMRI
jgi:serine phosphatase RsbU (regulator of sigma subunit)/Tfp pilus assembly protein PilF